MNIKQEHLEEDAARQTPVDLITAASNLYEASHEVISADGTRCGIITITSTLSANRCQLGAREIIENRASVALPRCGYSIV